MLELPDDAFQSSYREHTERYRQQMKNLLSSNPNEVGSAGLNSTDTHERE
jgi:hypothetical protein